MKTTITLLFFLLQVSCSLFAYSPTSLNENPVKADSASIEKYPAKNVIYFDLATIIILGYANISYERLISEIISIRAGYGMGFYFYIPFRQEFNLMANIFTSKQNSKFEIGLGVSYFWKLWENGNKIGLGPAISFGYRYQPKYGGFIFRIGGSWMGWWGDNSGFVGNGGLHISFGHAF